MIRILSSTALAALVGAAFVHALMSDVLAHGDVTPQAVDTSGLPDLGEEWLEENPWRDPAGKNWKRAIEVGASGYNQNCARCHGLGGVSGGLAPDVRYLSADLDGDEWYLERYQNGYTQGGVTKMPAFGELLSQEAAWAIRTYIETRPDADSMNARTADLQSIKTDLESMLDSGKSMDDLEERIASIKASMTEISIEIETGSGAPQADSIASEAAGMLNGTGEGLAKAIEILTIGLSAAQ